MRFFGCFQVPGCFLTIGLVLLSELREFASFELIAKDASLVAMAHEPYPLVPTCTNTIFHMKVLFLVHAVANPCEALVILS